MRRDLPLARLIAQTRLFVDEQAQDQRAPRSGSLAAKHDALYGWALARGYARWLTVTIPRRRVPPLAEHAEARFEQVQWWPANHGSNLAPTLLLVRTDAFDNDWSRLRAAMEPGPKLPAIWSEDPALFVKHPEGYVCRTACVGREGFVYYLAYDQEDEWIEQLQRAGLAESDLRGQKAYLGVIQTPGKVAGS